MFTCAEVGSPGFFLEQQTVELGFPSVYEQRYRSRMSILVQHTRFSRGMLRLLPEHLLVDLEGKQNYQGYF